MSKLNDLYDQQGQSPWLDNLKRGWITSGELERWVVERGVRGITSNPTIFAKAISGSPDYDDQFGELVRDGQTVETSYWELVKADIEDGLRILRPIYDASDGEDGYISIEVAPELARDTAGTITSARELWEQIDDPNLLVKIPGTAEGLPAIQKSLSDGININVTLLFGLERYAEVIDAYLDAIEERVNRGDDVSRLASVASFFVSRVDTEVDRRLDAIGTPRRSRCGARPRWPTPSWPTSSSSTASAASGGSASRPPVPCCSGRCGRRRRRRTRPTRRRSTSTRSSGRTRSTPCRRRRSTTSRRRAPSPAPSTPTSARLTR